MWNWYLVIPVALYYVVMPAAVFLFFSRFFDISPRWFWCVIYVILSGCVTALEYRFSLRGSPGLVLEILVLACVGKLCLMKSWAVSLAASCLALAVREAADGIMSWVSYRLLLPAVMELEYLVYVGDGIRELLKVMATLWLFIMIQKKFRNIIRQSDKRTLIWLAIPAFFLSMTERIIQNSIYGGDLVMDTDTGNFGAIININHGEILFLQIFSCLCLFLSLFAWEKIMTIVQRNQQLFLLEQQIRNQEIYVQEACGRLEKTRGFRHDIRNHLTVLAELLEEDQTEAARNYLSGLEQFSRSLSDELWTGNAAVSALLRSKVSAAGQRGIGISCQVTVPENLGIRDMDLCVVLSNGIDNAVQACQAVPEEKRYIEIRSRKKANFYFIFMENSCDMELKEVPKDGIGLSNIRTVAELYGGRAENEVSDGRYRLKVLFTTQNTDSAPEPSFDQASSSTGKEERRENR